MEKRVRDVRYAFRAALFERAADAVAFAMDYHPALSALAVPLSARAGLHVGPVILRYNSADDIALGAKPIEVEGLAKPTAARVMSIARGGQTLLTADARTELGPTDLKLESHGHWIVKGVDEPIELFEVARPGTRCVAPADSEKAHRVIKAADWWMPVRDIPNNLPYQSTSFVGRDAEIDDVKSLLEKARLVTLLGMGGLGKTRLCLQVAAETMHRFPDGVWFLDLAPLRDKALVVAEANNVVGVQAEPDRTPLQSLCARLKVKRALLVLDNCEHLVAASAELCHAVMRDAPHVRFIATSREALRVPGEQGYPLHPLPLPSSNAGLEELAFFLGIFTRQVGTRAALAGLLLGLLTITAVAFGTRLAWPWYTLVGSLSTLGFGLLARLVWTARGDPRVARVGHQ